MLIKSDFKSFNACPRQFAFKKAGMEEAPESYVVTRRFAQGEAVGELALKLFNDVHVIDPNQSLKKRISRTQEALKEKRFIAEASFSYDNAFCAIDILEQTSEGVTLYEVKSKTKIEKELIEDAAYQTHIVKSAGLNVTKIVLIYVNKTYIRRGDINVNQFFHQEVITEKVNAYLDKVPQTLKKLQAQEEIPEFVPVSACNECPFKSHCYQNLPEDSMVNLYDYRYKTKRYLEGARTLQEMILFEPKLTEVQKRQIDYHYDSLPDYVDPKAVFAFISQIEYPIYYLDFETLDYVIPPFENTSPNEKLPYQASLHIEPNKGGLIKHEELLINPPEDPREQMIKFLIHHLGTQGSIVVYHKTFETKVIEVLEKRFPQYQELLRGIRIRIIDLKEPFTKGMIYTDAMGNSFSIKNVYPAMVPEKKNAYKELDTVQNGTTAMEALEKLSLLSESKKYKVRKQLLDYCELDTLSMFEILDKIRIIL